MTAGAPHHIDGPEAWHGDELAASDDWIHRLGPEEIDDVDAALDAARRRGLAWRDIGRDEFPLGAFAETLARVSHELEHGRGLRLVRGLPVARYSDDELRIVIWGIGAHLGTAMPQSSFGEMIGEVRDEIRAYGKVRGPDGVTGDASHPSSRARARSSGPLRFHSDRADVIALLCVRPAKAGGVSQLASSVAVHNAMLARRPELCALLYGDYYRSRLGEELGGENAYYALPVWGLRDGRFTSHYSRTFVEAAQKLPGVPKMTAQQDEALDLHAAIAEELCHHVALEAGDINFINNHVVYHARTAYEDDDAANSDRLLMRLWLSMPNSRALPEGHEVLWGNIAAGAPRGGVREAIQAAG